MFKQFLGLIIVLCLLGYGVMGQPCIKPREPKLFVDGRELPVDFKTYTLNLCAGQTKKLTFETQNSEYKYFIGKATGERLVDNKTFGAGIPASVDVEFDNAVEGSYTIYVFSGADTDGTTQPACSSDPVTLVLGKSFFGPRLDLDYTGSRDTCLNSVIQMKARGSQGSILWTKNGIPDGTSDNYSFTLNDATEITAILTPTDICALPKTPVFATINFTVSSSQTPTVTIKRSDLSVQNCEGEEVSFSIKDKNMEGNFPTYQWFVDGQPAPGKTDPLNFTLKDWTNGARVQLELSRNDGCTSQSKVMSNTIELRGNPKNNTPVNILEIRNSTSNAVCKGTEVTLAPVTNMKGLQYVWTGPGVFYPDSIYTTTVDQTTTYKVSAFLSDCATGSDTDSIEIKVVDNMPVSIKEKLPGSNEFPVCEGSLTTFTGASTTPGFTFVWLKNNQEVGFDSSVSLADLVNGDVVKVQSAAAFTCPGNIADSVIIKITNRPETGFSNGTGPLYYCGSPSVLLTPVETSNSFPYKWYKNQVLLNITTPTYAPPDSGQYKVIIGSGSCTSESLIEVKEYPLSVILSAKPVQFTPGDEVSLSAEVNKPSGDSLTYKWEPEGIILQPGLQNTIARPLETTDITVAIRTVNGCSATGSITVIKIEDTSVVVPDTLPVIVKNQLFIPNAFTPATIDQNSFWGISGVELYPELDIKVYNRWGNMVYESKGYSTPWDGTINGKDLPTGTYYYLIQDKSFNKPFTGPLTIYR